jgi:hypothetical protein
VCGWVCVCVGDIDIKSEISTFQYSLSSTALPFLDMTSHFLEFPSKNYEIVI